MYSNGLLYIPLYTINNIQNLRLQVASPVAPAARRRAAARRSPSPPRRRGPWPPWPSTAPRRRRWSRRVQLRWGRTWGLLEKIHRKMMENVGKFSRKGLTFFLNTINKWFLAGKMVELHGRFFNYVWAESTWFDFQGLARWLAMLQPGGIWMHRSFNVSRCWCCCFQEHSTIWLMNGILMGY